MQRIKRRDLLTVAEESLQKAPGVWNKSNLISQCSGSAVSPSTTHILEANWFCRFGLFCSSVSAFSFSLNADWRCPLRVEKVCIETDVGTQETQSCRWVYGLGAIIWIWYFCPEMWDVSVEESITVVCHLNQFSSLYIYIHYLYRDFSVLSVTQRALSTKHIHLFTHIHTTLLYAVLFSITHHSFTVSTGTEDQTPDVLFSGQPSQPLGPQLPI